MSTLVMVLLAIFLPPVAVLFKEGVGVHLLISILLCFLWFPAAIHALILVLRYKPVPA